MLSKKISESRFRCVTLLRDSAKIAPRGAVQPDPIARAKFHVRIACIAAPKQKAPPREQERLMVVDGEFISRRCA
jgi:hypothetical protein